jgi:Transcriptional regulator/sugar kinase
MNNDYYLAFDFGGTKIDVVIYDKDYKIINKLQEKSSFLNNEFNRLILFIEKIIRWVNNFNFKKVGVALNGWVKEGKILKWRQFKNFSQPVFYQFLKKFKAEEIIIKNDVVAAAEAEKKFGFGKSYNSFLFVNLGTGLRVVYIENNHLVTGYNFLAGEIGLDTFFYENKEIEIEEIFSGRVINKILEKSKNKLKPEDFFKSRRFKERFEEYLAKTIFRSLIYYNPQAIIFSGSIVKSKKYWMSGFLKNLKKQRYYKIFKPEKFLFSKIKYAQCLGSLI